MLKQAYFTISNQSQNYQDSDKFRIQLHNKPLKFITINSTYISSPVSRTLFVENSDVQLKGCAHVDQTVISQKDQKIQITTRQTRNRNSQSWIKSRGTLHKMYIHSTTSLFPHIRIQDKRIFAFSSVSLEKVFSIFPCALYLQATLYQYFSFSCCSDSIYYKLELFRKSFKQSQKVLIAFQNIPYFHYFHLCPCPTQASLRIVGRVQIERFHKFRNVIFGTQFIRNCDLGVCGKWRYSLRIVNKVFKESCKELQNQQQCLRLKWIINE